MLIDRSLLSLIKKNIDGEPKICIIYGPRQAGKTTLIKQILAQLPNIKTLLLTGDDIQVQNVFGVNDLEKLRAEVGDTQLLVIDEAQRVPNIGLSLKLIFDQLGTRILVSGSSSFDLANKVNEPLTGRSSTFNLYPLSVLEVPKKTLLHFPERLGEFLRFGLYPKILDLELENEKQQYLYELVNNYLYRDILEMNFVKKPKKVIDLLSLLALQIGCEVSTTELASKLTLSKSTVESYLDILEKMFVIINLRGFSRNLRKEISKTSKYYFVDLGLRNALIRNFNSLNLRSDVGVMFENFAFVERVKALANRREYANWYFWRTYDQKEIDLIEERDGKLRAVEFKLSAKQRVRKSTSEEFKKTYAGSTFESVSPETLEKFLNS